MPRPLLVIVHPGACCATGDAAAAQPIIAALRDWAGDLLVLHDARSDTLLPAHPPLSAALLHAMIRVSRAQGYASGAWTASSGVVDTLQVQLRAREIGADTPITLAGMGDDARRLSEALSAEGYHAVRILGHDTVPPDAWDLSDDEQDTPPPSDQPCRPIPPDPFPGHCCLAAGTLLYHGTSSHNFSEARSPLRAPAWLTTAPGLARRFACQPAAGGVPRIVVYRLRHTLVLPRVETPDAMMQLTLRHGLDLARSHRLRGALLRSGLAGWMRPQGFGYPDGDDILLTDTSVLAYAGTWSLPNPAGAASARARLDAPARY